MRAGEAVTIKILGKEYRVRGDGDTDLHQVATYVDGVLREMNRGAKDTQDAAILAALNIASELMGSKGSTGVPRARVQELIDLVDSA